jgi:hypothetical protein
VEASGQRSNGDFNDYLDSRFHENWVDDEDDDAEYARSEGEEVQDNKEESPDVQQSGDQVPGLKYRKEDPDDDDPPRSEATQTSILSTHISGFAESSVSNETSSSGTSNDGRHEAYSTLSSGLSDLALPYSSLATIPHPPLHVMESHTSKQKIDVLWHLKHPDQRSFPGTLLQAGDVLRFQDGDWIKDARASLQRTNLLC